jgi:hypothetical protein
MSKGETRTGRENRKPKKAAPPKQNASNPSQKGVAAAKPADKAR